MNPDNITPDTLPEEETPQGGEGAVEDTNEESTDSEAPVTTDNADEKVENLSLSDLNELLGKDFPTKDAALKSIKDTYKHVGKRTDDIESDLKDKGYMTKQEAEDMFFFRDKPEHAPNKDMLEAIAAKDNITISEAAETESYKKLFEGSAKYEEHQSNESVMDSNPRIAEQAEKLDAVKELQNSGNTDGARDLAAKTVLDAFSNDK